MMTLQNVEQISGDWFKKKKDFIMQRKLRKELDIRNDEFLKLVRGAKEELKIARDNFNFAVDKDLLEYYIYEIKAAETKLNYFLSMAKKEKLSNENYIAELFYDYEPKGSVSV